MSVPIFISYRRADSAAEAGRLHSTISRELGEEVVFMDTSSIEIGTQWSEELEEALQAAQIVIVVIGPDWLRISDEYGLRRIDQDNDWVRREIEFTLRNGKKLLPLLVRGAKIPPSDKLPASISALTERQAVEIRDAYWAHDIKLVLEQLKLVINKPKNNESSLTRNKSLGVYPTPPPEKPDPITEEKLQIALKGNLSSWKKVINQNPDDPTKVRTEIFRRYKFKSFLDAVGFMNQVAAGCEIALHHPRWENIWKTVDVYLSTWDIEHQISDRDIQLAKYFDKAFSDFPGADLEVD
ncbi:4a-hydroxytetrahydrobiopterin dehydratase [Allocoleopsis franciscana]|uniref:4a-hydroxytetrahydrobiopterin dehydratase n=1 Tax=Allocoleopsis franciscana PCC 7113 TaxID=1173027 RepID=K9WC03_9CYAN|nr:4a-hydroxytetrahydrobiopterin dehydratase [Allocoleopsis franciscana]AFZ17920.1 pterin-4a-carbinolamine dehydratase [Allocoleopsis franciscana PCC 7113]